MHAAQHDGEKHRCPPSLFDMHRRFLELQSEFASLLTMEPSGKAVDCDAVARVLREHLYAAKMQLLRANAEGALSEIQLARANLDKLTSLLLAPTKEAR